jgi:uncharacterized protein DUF6088
LISLTKRPIFVNETMGPNSSKKNTEEKMLSRLKEKKRGWVFTPRDFEDFGDRHSIGMALLRQMKKGTIRRLGRGLYDFPRTHPDLGPLSPSVDAVANALKGRDAIRLQPSGAYAANLLGLSQQVPMKVVFLTDGSPRRVHLGRQEIILKSTTPRNMATAGRVSGLVIQALRHIGQRHIDDSTVRDLQQRLSDDDKKTLLKDRRYAPRWIADLMEQIARSDRE